MSAARQKRQPCNPDADIVRAFHLGYTKLTKARLTGQLTRLDIEISNDLITVPVSITRRQPKEPSEKSHTDMEGTLQFHPQWHRPWLPRQLLGPAYSTVCVETQLALGIPDQPKDLCIQPSERCI